MLKVLKIYIFLKYGKNICSIHGSKNVYICIYYILTCLLIYTDLSIYMAQCGLISGRSVLYIPRLELIHMLSMNAEIHEERRLI